MSADWQAGDLALCVNDDNCAVFGKTTLRKGVSYTVIAVRYGKCRTTGLEALGLKVAGVNDTPPWHHEKRFVKANGHTPDEEDAETIALLTGQPVREVA